MSAGTGSSRGVRICNRHQGILAVIPPLNEDDEPDEATAERDPCDNANARRIVAAVNACQDLGTEALEQGVVPHLLEALRGLLTPAGDLDAALDRATDQFGDERATLDTACRIAGNAVARATAGPDTGGTELDVHELLAGRGQIALLRSIDDVREVRPDLTDRQAWEVLKQVERRHDATRGVTWETLGWTAQDLFGDAPETGEA
jgi:hypothetical protein